MSLKKQFLKSKPIVKVTFTFPKEAADSAETVNLVGEFNDWSISATPMKKLKNGNFTVTMDLDADQEFQFRYLVNEQEWENDWAADKYEKSAYGNCDNSVVVTKQ